MPMIAVAIAPTAPPMIIATIVAADHRIGEVRDEPARRHARNADERHLPEADLARPTRQHHEGDADDRVDQHRRGLLHPVLGQEHRHAECGDRDRAR